MPNYVKSFMCLLLDALEIGIDCCLRFALFTDVNKSIVHACTFFMWYFVSSTNLFQESKELIRPLNQRARSALNPH
jgi:hypothetical protein